MWYFFPSKDFSLTEDNYYVIPNYGTEGFVAKYDSDRNIEWIQQFHGGDGDTSFVRLKNLQVTSQGDVYASGSFASKKCYFGVDTSYNLDVNNVSGFGYDGYLVKLNNNGSTVFAKRIDAVNTNVSGFDFTVSVHEDLFAIGEYAAYDTIDVDPSNDTAYIFNDAPTYSGDYFLKMSPCERTFSSTVDSACFKYFLPTGKIIEESGIYHDTLVNQLGCDSIITFDLFITNVNTILTKTDSSLYVLADQSSYYHWVDCDNANQIISGQNNSTFFPSIAGDYAAIISKEGCVDTTECLYFAFQNVTSIDILDTEQIFIHPNPTDGILYMNIFFSLETLVDIEVVDVAGRTILTKSSMAYAGDSSLSIDVSDIADGAYWVVITQNGMKKVQYFIKK